MRGQKATRLAARNCGYHPTALAKKARTPAPPRSVQAPQRRDSKKRRVPPVGGQRRPPWLLYGFAALGPIALVIVLVVLFVGGNSSSSKNPKGKPPNIDYAKLPDRLAPLGLNALSQEALAFHIHQHLDIFVNGKKVAVPAFIGIDDGSFITELHTHDASGIIHVESAQTKPYTLGQFMSVWGVRFSKRCIGGYCASGGKPLRFYLNGKPFRGNPDNLILKNHQEIAVVYGKAPKKIPSTYDFAAYGV